MADDIRFQQLARRMDGQDKKLKNFDKLIRNLESRMKKREIEHSQLAYAHQQSNNIVKHLVLQNYLLQKRTGGTLTNEELTEGQQELEALHNERQKNLKQSSIQPASAGPVKRGG